MPKELTYAEYEAERAAKHCPIMCVEEWLKMGLPCPGCTVWVDKDGKVWRRINFMHSESEDEDV